MEWCKTEQHHLSGINSAVHERRPKRTAETNGSEDLLNPICPFFPPALHPQLIRDRVHQVRFRADNSDRNSRSAKDLSGVLTD